MNLLVVFNSVTADPFSVDSVGAIFVVEVHVLN